MSGLQFETPENVQIQYEPAGLGTRFIAWVVDWIISFILVFVLLCVLSMTASALMTALAGYFEAMEDWLEDFNPNDPQQTTNLMAMIVGLGYLLWGFTSLFYFLLSEWFMSGQTIGKRLLRIRVIHADGLSLNALSVFVRNVFRLVDHLPLLWVVPLLSARSQRLGDMVAGTVVVSDDAADISPVREQLAGRSAAEAKFRFDTAKLTALDTQDFDVVEKMLERTGYMALAQEQALLGRLVTKLCKKMSMDVPPPEEHHDFLEDLLSAEYRRQSRTLG